MRASVVLPYYLCGTTSGVRRVVEDESWLLLGGAHHADVWTPLYEETSKICAGIAALARGRW